MLVLSSIVNGVVALGIAIFGRSPVFVEKTGEPTKMGKLMLSVLALLVATKIGIDSVSAMRNARDRAILAQVRAIVQRRLIFLKDRVYDANGDVQLAANTESGIDTGSRGSQDTDINVCQAIRNWHVHYIAAYKEIGHYSPPLASITDIQNLSKKLGSSEEKDRVEGCKAIIKKVNEATRKLVEDIEQIERMPLY